MKGVVISLCSALFLMLLFMPISLAIIGGVVIAGYRVAKLLMKKEGEEEADLPVSKEIRSGLVMGGLAVVSYIALFFI